MEIVKQVLWSDQAKEDLKDVFYFHKEYSEEYADKIVDELIDASYNITYTKQFQKDDLNPNYRRIIHKDYKLLYKAKSETISILKVISTKDNPNKVKEA